MTGTLKKPAESGPGSRGRIARFFEPLKNGLLGVAEGGAGVLSLIGAPVALLLGKLFLAAILMGVVAGVWLRFASRARRQKQEPVLPVAFPRWPTFAAGGLAAVEIAFLVESTKLAVRTDQPNFEQSNWLWVLLAWGVAFYVQRGWLQQWFIVRKSRAPALRD